MKQIILACIDVLYESKIEIVPPKFMNQRLYSEEKSFVLKALKVNTSIENSKTPEDIIFDKTNEAESREKIKEMIVKNKEDHITLVKELEKSLKNEDI